MMPLLPVGGIIDHRFGIMTTPGHKEIVEFEHWLNHTFGSLVKGGTVKERVMSVLEHYINQMGRWLAKEE